MKKFFIISLILLIYYSKQQSNTLFQGKYITCETNFNCINTGCCYDNKCQESSKCKKINTICYILVGVAGFVIIALNFLYFWFKIKKTRKVVLELKKLDDKIYSKRKGSNIELIKKLRRSTNA